jgi:hypothetical protein
MEREIKFRGKSTLTEERLNELEMNHDIGWVTGFFVISGNTPYIIGEIVDSDEDYVTPDFWTPVIPESVGQFTGLKDKNGIEIYEGDIVKIKSQNHFFNLAVSWGNYGDGYGYHPFMYVRRDDVHFGNIDPLEALVIGNIYENPELLS